MRQSFRLRLAGTYLCLIIIILVISGITLFNLFKDYYIKNVESSLIYEARLIAEMIDMRSEKPTPQNLQKVCQVTGKDTNTRVTIIGQNGVVLADSLYDAAKLGLHNTRPEVYQALKGKTGVEIRYSTTVKAKMIYVAVPFTGMSAQGVVRLATPLLAVEEIYSRMWSILMFAIVICGLAAFGVSLIFVERISRPIGNITATVREFAHGNLHKRISYRREDELGVLARTFNDMAEYLENNIIEISEVNNRLETLLENTVNGIVMVDRSARITYTNPAAVELLGESIQTRGKKHVEVISNYELVETIDKVRQQLQPIHKEIVLHSMGDRIIDVNVVPLRGNTFSGQGVLVVLNDISNLKKLEQMRKDFVANVSHELKTPVASISGFAETLVAEEGQNPETVKEFSRIIFDESQRLTRLVSRLLELSRLESEDRELQIEEINVDQLIQDTINMMQQRNDCKDKAIEFSKTGAPVVINGDSDTITQVLINLLDNAIKYGSEGDHIAVSLAEEKDQIKISVEDHGVGIPENEAERIFERFYRVDKTRCRKTGGTGLGLAIAKHLVENHGGQIGAETISGQGTVFSFTIPKNI
ncbi:MAG TPA: hypothetical protein DD811_05915 [Syntrophomonas sp.]|jgi:two-component system phosphate regulon sensor histidine kinase PhoR|nr:hypothetical protein [Syntrophomonas sp.]